ncbi:hypothetical protein [Chitinophaga rhizophila]|uniref:Uncharacterized protein n=1 Tax=Chitinophaga rhizophila TaxID=2866212 RepID=A0ABS7GF25_9BACT|nr:hypothetical protein [Chitinophaga rhizophila]MBW8686277.1 hypothetical protein [Chitinophaga rhizophila]
MEAPIAEGLEAGCKRVRHMVYMRQVMAYQVKKAGESGEMPERSIGTC